jgi:hypothetical protein
MFKITCFLVCFTASARSRRSKPSACPLVQNVWRFPRPHARCTSGPAAASSAAHRLEQRLAAKTAEAAMLSSGRKQLTAKRAAVPTPRTLGTRATGATRLDTDEAAAASASAAAASLAVSRLKRVATQLRDDDGDGDGDGGELFAAAGPRQTTAPAASRPSAASSRPQRPAAIAGVHAAVAALSQHGDD